MNILALDLRKYKTVFCEYDSENGKHDFGKINTTPQEMHDLFFRFQKPINRLRSISFKFSTFKNLKTNSNAALKRSCL